MPDITLNITHMCILIICMQLNCNDTLYYIIKYKSVKNKDSDLVLCYQIAII